RFLLVTLAGWMNQHQQHAIAYLVEENRVLREQIGHRHMRFTDDQRRRLAVKAKILGAKMAVSNRTAKGPDAMKKANECLQKFAKVPASDLRKKWFRSFSEKSPSCTRGRDLCF